MKYIGDPFVAVKIFNELQAMELIISDTTPSKLGNSLDLKLLGQISSECFMPVTYAGGISDIYTASKILSLGIEKLCISSAYHLNPNFLKELVKEFGTSTIIACIELKETNGQTKVTYQSGQRYSNWSAEDCVKKLQDDGVGEILVIDTNRDGKMDGGNESWVKGIKSKLKIPLIYAGGIGQSKHSLAMFNSGASAVAIGSAFVYKGRLNGVLINYPDHSQISEWTGEESFLLKKF